MAERKSLTITQVKEIQKVGNRQIPKLSFTAKDGDKELSYFTFKTSLFDSIKEGQIINADVETSTREYDGNTYTDRRIVQIYVDGQPVMSKGTGFYKGKSPEELELSAKSYALSYAKDLAVAGLIPLDKIPGQADIFYKWLKGNGKESPKVPEPKLRAEVSTSSEAETSVPESESTPIGNKVQNITELKGLMAKHKIGTHEVYEILSIKSFMELTDLDEAWAKIKKAKGIEP
jgi:hypothetical protein